jgi:DNA repair protein RadC
MELFIREAEGSYLLATPEQVMEGAITTAHSKLAKGELMNKPEIVSTYLIALLYGLEHEVFWVIFLDTQHRIIASEELFRGTLNHASVYPREVAKAALKHNAAGVILAHNHPSELVEPSECDKNLTAKLKQALALLDVRVIDHFIVAGSKTFSFAERGIL